MVSPRGRGRVVVGWVGVALLAALAAAPGSLAGQEGEEAPPSLRALPLEDGDAIEVDGHLTEEAWDAAPPAVNFTMQEPVEGGQPTERTEIRVAYTADALYIGALLHDSDPSGVIGHQLQRDAGLGTDDRFMWILDTFLDGRTAYFFEVNPAGLMGDGLLRTGVRVDINKSWDGIWEARVQKGDYGWSVEVRIPFRTLNFDPSLGEWGINFQRTVRRKNEEILWSGHRLNQGLFRPVHAGRLTGLEGLSQGIGLEAIPYAVGGWTHSPADSPDDPDDFHRDAGLDLQYSITPSLRASLTLNTDFAEVEVDRRRLNLTRFPISFPERRDFFLEGASVFSFLPANGVTPFFSRRIGLVEGQQVPVQGGARLAGQAGAWDLGFYQVRTGKHSTGPAEDFTAARVKRNIFSQSSLGFVYTSRDAHAFQGDPAARAELPEGETYGVDVDLFTSTFLGDKNLNFQAFYVFHTQDPRGADTDHADRRTRGVRMAYPNDVWDAHISFREFGEAWDPPVGFARRNGFRRVQPTVSFNPRPADSRWIRQYEFEVAFQYLTDLDGLLETRTWEITPLGLRFHSGASVEVDVGEIYERLTRDFPITEDITIPQGPYTMRGGRVGFSTPRQNALSLEADVERRDFWSGDLLRLGGQLTYHPRPGVTVSGGWDWNDVELVQGEFTRALWILEGGWQPSPWSSLTANLQYDDESELMGLYARFRYIVTPGSDLYLVYAHNWLREPGDLRTLSRGATTKLTYTYRF